MQHAPREFSTPSPPDGRRLGYIRPGALPKKPAGLVVLFSLTVVYAAVAFLVGVIATAFFAYVWWWEPSRIRPAPPRPVARANLMPYKGDSAGDEGLKSAQRQSVVEHLRERLKLSRDRAEMASRLLADVGSRIFPPGARLEPFDPNLVSVAGRLNIQRGADFLITARGRVELNDFTATWTPDGGKLARVVRNVLHDGNAPPRWSSVAIGQAIDDAHVRTSGSLTAPQATALLRELREASPPSNADQTWQSRPAIVRITVWQSGTISYRTLSDSDPAAQHWLLPDGTRTTVAVAPFGIDPLTAVPYTRPKPQTYRHLPGSQAAMAMMSVIGFLEALLAAYLFRGALLLIGDPLAGARRHLRYLLCGIPLLVLGIVVVATWVHSLNEYANAASPSGYRGIILFIASLALLGFPTLALVLLCGRRVRYYFAVCGEDPFSDVRQFFGRLAIAGGARRGRAALRGTGLLLAILSGANVAVAIWCLAAAAPAQLRGSINLLCAAGAAAGAVLLLRSARIPVPGSATVTAIIALCCCVGASQPATAPISPWAIEEFMRTVREEHSPRAVAAVRRLAAAREFGQEALLQLLEGPPPPIGIDGLLSAIGDEWLDRGVLWAPQYQRRALWLTPEWTESIAGAQDARRMGALEAIGAVDELEPLLRPLLICRDSVIRHRAARLLFQINPHPRGVVAQLRRDLANADTSTRRAIIVGLVGLRKTADATLARLMLGPDRQNSAAVVAALLDAAEPLSAELLAAASKLAEHDSEPIRAPAIQLLRLTPEGRDELIALSLSDSHSSRAAQSSLGEIWPHIEPVFWRVADGGTMPQAGSITLSARRVLRALNAAGGSHSGLLELTEQLDEETRAQASMVLATGDYGGKLGPATYCLIERWLEPGARRETAVPQWRVRSLPATHAGALEPPPPWLSLLAGVSTVILPTLALPLALLHRGSPDGSRRRAQR